MSIVLDGTNGVVVSGNTNTLSGITVGKGAGSVSTNTAVGANVLAANTTGAGNNGFGYQSLNAVTTGNYNVGVGNAAVGNNTTGSSNTGIGYAALISNTTASNNTAVGYQAGYSNQTGAYSVFIGQSAGYSSNVSGTAANTYVGQTAGYYSTTATYNAFFGNGSGSLITTGSKNTILGGYSGNQGGLNITTANNYIVLSDGDGNPRGVFDSSGNLLVGTTSDVNSGGFKFFPNYSRTGSSAVEMGHISGSASGEGFVGFKYNGSTIGSITQNGTTGVLYNLTSDYRLKNNPEALTGAKDFVMALQPKKWQWWDGSGEGIGFIAHEFMEVAKYSGNGEKDAVDADGKPVYQSIQPSSSEVMANLVSLLQEQQALITQLQADVAALKGQA